MGTAKDIYEILTDLYDRISGQPRGKKLNLSEDLHAIASLLDASREKFEHKQVPRREAMELATLINHAGQLAEVFEQKDPELARVFDQRLPRIGKLMRDVDFFIDERPRYRLHTTFDTKDPKFPVYAGAAIREACEEMQRAAGIISAYSRKYQQEGKA